MNYSARKTQVGKNDKLGDFDITIQPVVGRQDGLQVCIMEDAIKAQVIPYITNFQG